MKRIATIAFAAVALCVPAAQASAAKGPTMAQFNALKAQLAKDEKKIKDLEAESNYTYGVMLCLNAIAADTYQGTWQAIDSLATSLGKTAIFGPQTTIVNDADACNGLGKIARSHAIPKDVLLFSAVAKMITG